MPTRVTFHEELRVLEDTLVAMADIAGASLDKAVLGLLQGDMEVAAAVIQEDDRINQLHSLVTRHTLELIATQQPLASDLREVLAIFSMATDLERFGDHAKGIARVAQRRGMGCDQRSAVRLAELSDLVRGFLTDAVDAFVRRDGAAAGALARRDDEVDRMYVEIYGDVLQEMEETPTAVGPGEHLLWVAKSLERCGDHVTNMVEWIVFQATGELVELNP